MLIDDLNALLEVGASLHVGFAADDGSPFASRGFGLSFLAAEPLSVQVLVPAATILTLDRTTSSAPFALAVTVSSIRAFRSIQLKGTAGGVRPATLAEVEAAHRQLDPLFAALTEIGGQRRESLEAVVPDDLWACTLAVAEAFDQTPGPGAGRALDGAGR